MAFGAPSGGGLFGSPFPTNASPGFGQSAPAPSPFGASAPGFGAPASQGAFSFSQATPTAAPATNLFGTPAASPSPFGGTPGSLFGGANASPGAFGANATPAPFGASTAPNIFGGASTPAFGTGGFGAASSPSLFGSSTPATTSAFGGTMFGAQPASGAGMFGSQQAGTSLFGTPQPAAGGGMFGAQQPTAANVFGAPQAAAPNMFGAPAAAPAPQTDSTVKELMEIKAAYTPGNPLYRFQYLLLNVVDNPASRVKPPGIDELRWRQALAAAGGPDNPDRLWPVPANGFRDLVARSTAQVSAVDENAARLRALQDLAFRLAKRQGGDLKQRATDIQRQHQELASRLLHVTRLLDALESRLATTMGYRGDVARAKEDKLSRQLAAVEMELAPGSVTGLTRRLDATAHAAHMAAANPVACAAAQTKLDERSNAALLSVLRDHADGVAKLQALLKRDLQDVAIMRHELGGDGPGGGQGMVQLD